MWPPFFPDQIVGLVLFHFVGEFQIVLTTNPFLEKVLSTVLKEAAPTKTRCGGKSPGVAIGKVMEEGTPSPGTFLVVVIMTTTDESWLTRLRSWVIPLIVVLLFIWTVSPSRIILACQTLAQMIGCITEIYMRCSCLLTIVASDDLTVTGQMTYIYFGLTWVCEGGRVEEVRFRGWEAHYWLFLMASVS